MNRDAPVEPLREELVALIAAQAAEIAALRAHIAELERRLGLNSSNSGKPPSSDGLKKPPRVASLRERSGNKPGGQKGHDGETLRQVAEPDNIIDHFPQACAECGLTLTPTMATGHSARQVFDLPTRSLPSSPNIAPTTAGARPAARGRGPPFPKASTRRCSTASGSRRSCSICCTTNCGRMIDWPS